MKKFMIVLAGYCFMVACNSTDTNNTAGGDSTGSNRPTAIDTTKHPTGLSHQNVISTDTAAMNMQNSVDKLNEAKKKQ